MKTHAELIDAIGLEDFASGTNVTIEYARVMKTRNSIATKLFPRVVALAEQKLIENITFDRLLSMKESKSNAPAAAE